MENHLSDYIDHLILVLAGRFGAEEADEERWELVAAGVRHALAGPAAPAERAALRAIDPDAFSATVCRARAGYLLWRTREEARAAKAPPPPASGASGYDVNRDSLARDVSAIFAAVRANLPTIAPSSGDDEESDGDGAVPPIQEHTRHTAAGEPFVRTEAEERKDRAIAREREALLSRVQAMQADFYRRHGRWVDVPADFLDDSSAKAAAAAAARSEEDEERRQLLAALGASGPSGGAAASPGSDAAPRASGAGGRPVLESLKRAVHVERPERPSRMSDDAIEQLYAAAARGSPAGRASAPRDSTPQTAVKETSPPNQRGARWNIVEYDDDEKDSDDDS